MLSVIDVHSPGNMLALVPRLEALGYARYWTTEHHSPEQSGSPAVLIAIAASATKHIRIGCAGVLLRFASPLKVAEDFRLLELFFRGRIDLGIAGGGHFGPAERALLDGRPAPSAEAYVRKVEELARLVQGHPSLDGELAGVRAGPDVESAPELWVCGLRPESAALAARLGAGFAFHEHIRRNTPHANLVDCRDLARCYHAEFRYGPGRSAPRVVVVCYGLCAEHEREARRHWDTICARIGAQIVPTFLGTPEQCHAQLSEVQAQSECDELVVQSFTDDNEARLSSYELLAEAFHLLPRPSGSTFRVSGEG